MSYRHTQTGWFLVAVFVPILAILAMLLTLEASADRAVLWLVSGVLLVALAAFVSLTVTIADRTLTVRFGLTPFRRQIPLGDIVSVRPVRIPWYHGWGIRYAGGGWLYRVGGSDAVELAFRNGRRVRIGTDEPEVLVRALEATDPGWSRRQDTPPAL